MSLLRTTLCLLTVLLAAAAFGQPSSCCPPHSTGPHTYEVIQEFPAMGPMQTAWKVHYAHATAKGLFITGAWFKTSPTAPWMRVLWDARISEIFVPYHLGSPRFYDITGFNFPIVAATPADAGCCGMILDGFVIKEVRDRGILWKNDTAGYRGEEMVLWATLDAANYNYVMQYGFQDDGTITFRVGATAVNLPGSERIAHMHTTLWRVDMDLNGFTNDSPFFTRHLETTTALTASDSATLFNGGIEGGAVWNDLEFNGLRVQDTVTVNGKGNNISYDLMPLRRGTARHQESFSHQDFWVTRSYPSELHYKNIGSYVNGESIANTDVVLWHSTGAHHMPRDEDGESVGGRWQGVALVMWTGFDLRPRNLFDRTPFYP